MNLINSLLETYNFALENKLVGSSDRNSSDLVILPVYHSSKKSTGEDIFEITIDEDSNPVSGKFLDKDKIVIFPITEDSIIRAGARIAPHSISDELSYLSKEADSNKNERYLEAIKELLDYEKNQNCSNFRIIGEYIIKNTILSDFLKFYLGNKKYTIDDKFKLNYEELDSKNKVKKKTINLGKIFITFKIERELSGDIPLTRDEDIHNFYIKYIRNKNIQHKELPFCNVTGKLDYCVERHRGLMGTAKLIGISNHKETYYGRFKNGREIYSLSYEASQRVHNMLKYLIESDNHSKYIGESAYIINWLSQGIDKGGIKLVDEIEEDDFEDQEETTIDILGGRISSKINQFFLGDSKQSNSKRDFYILSIEKISNGRLSLKYFRNLSRSDAYERVESWYKTTNWKFYDYNSKNFINKSPSLYRIADFLYGQENSKGFLSCENKKLRRSTIERLIPCIIDSQKLPKDILKTTIYNLSNKQSYKKSWNVALNVGCSLIKKYKNDYENFNIDFDNISEVKQLQENRSFYYGKLMSIYEKIELDAMKGKGGDNGSEKEKGKAQRITNADRLWSSMIRTPERTRFILETKIKPYMNMLKKNNLGYYVFFDKLITQITLEIIDLQKSNSESNLSLNEDFILGYYYQKNEFYRKKDN